MSLEKRQLVNLSYLYYEKNMTQQEISEKTGLSRMKISRLLQKARESKIIKILIDYSNTFTLLERELIQKYNLKDAIVIDSQLEPNSKNIVASAAAFYLETNLNENDIVAVGWGTTLQLIENHLSELKKNITFSPIIGGHGKSEFGIHASTVAASLAKKGGCNSLSLLAPAFVQTLSEKNFFKNDTLIKEVLIKSASANYAIFSLSNPIEPSNTLRTSGYFSDKDISLLHKEKAVSDIVSIIFLDLEGNVCGDSITNRSIGITANQLKNIPTKICVTTGEEKYLSTKIALEAGYIDVLIIDNLLGEFLL